MKPFDLSACPLGGVNLIEASAGTGKTHALAGLYLRFMVEKRLTVRQMLVITYTHAATAELKRRIRSMIADARSAFLSGETSTPLLKDLLDRYPESGHRRRIARDLGAALAGFDEAAIYTIHGFCQRILMDNAFASGEPFEAELIENQQRLEQEFVEDFWRSHFYENHPVIVRFALARKMDKSTLLALLRMVLAKPDIKIIPDYRPFSMDQFEKALALLEEDFSCFKSLCGRDREVLERMLRDKALSAVVYGKKVDGLLREVDQVLDLPDLPLPAPACLQKLSAGYLRQKTNKNQITPRHAAFDLVEQMIERSEELAESLNHYLAALKKEFMESARLDFPGLKRSRNVLYYDDLLTRAQEALCASGGERLAEILRGQYRAVLVDEFQDTDPIQFAILQNVFVREDEKADRALFYIGDPKQAIYSFRGADIYAYLRAAKHVDHRYTMPFNWRSETALVNAVNALFAGPERSFVYDEIRYRSIEPALNAGIKELSIVGEEGAGLDWWFVPGDEDGKPQGIAFARRLIYCAVVAEISRLLKAGRERKAFIGETPLTESDLAILVRRNSEAIAFKKQLAQAGISSVIYSTESVFSSDEALELRRLLGAAAHYENEGYVLSALATPFFNLRAGDIAACSDEDERLEEWRAKFKSYHELWRTKGILTLFNIILDQEGARPRIAASRDGERRLTNYMHLAHLLSQAQAEGHRGPSDLLRWFDEMSVSKEGSSEEHEQRLETDRHLVRIVTIHKSKGLEYPICFCPFTWETGPVPGDDLPLLFHDEENNWQTTADLGSARADIHKEYYNREILAENCRLIYVALTRAKNRCYFISGNIKGTTSGAVSYLFHRPVWTDKTMAFGNSEMIEQMMSFSSRGLHDIRISNVNAGSVIEKWLPEKETGDIFCREFRGRMDHRWKIASYSYLTRVLPDEAEWDEQTDLVLREDVFSETKTTDSLLFFPPGATSGILLHEILEKVDFPSAGGVGSRDLVRATLEKFNFAGSWQSAILKMIEEIAQARLEPPDAIGFGLAEVDSSRCLRELEFYFPLREIVPARLLSLLEGSPPRDKNKDQTKLNFPPVHGFLKGFIDLVFEHEGRYYLADWKSNHLGDDYDHYGPVFLEREIVRSYYDVQYLIYTVALDRYLRQRLPGYRYERHFGGVYYFFLRGVNAGAGKQNGIYFHRPDEHLISELTRTLVAGA